MAKIEPVDAAPAGPDVVQVAATTVAEAATAAAAAAASSMNVDAEQLTSDFRMDPAYTSSEQFQKSLNSDAANKRNRDTTQTLKVMFIISGAAVALVGALFAVSKKFKKAS